MSQKLKDFAEKVSKDQALSDKINALKVNDSATVEKIIAIAKENGFDLTKADFDSESIELSKDEMKAIIGTGGCGCAAFGHGGGDGLSCTCVMKGTGFIKGSGGITSQGGCVCIGAGAGATNRH